jgi:hypothetical protein
MSEQSDQFIAKMKRAHVILVIDGDFYLIPFASLEQFKMPAAFQRNTPGLDANYFHQAAGGAENKETSVHRGMLRALDGVFGLDGIDQAVRVLDAKEVGGITVSKTAQSGKVLFKYTPKNRIEVDLTRGGRPSDS